MARTLSRDLARTALSNPGHWTEAALPGTGRAAAALLAAESAGGRHQRTIYELFSEMEEKDGHFYAVIQTRLNGLLGLPRTVLPASDAPADHERAEFVDKAIESMPRPEGFLRALLDGLAKGFACIEVLWGYDAAGRIVPKDWIVHPQEYFLFDARGNLRLLAPPFRGGEPTGGDAGTERLTTPSPEPGRSIFPTVRTLAPPARKFVVLQVGADARHPYGRGLAQRAYWFYWLKKNSLKYWSIYNERYGAPTAVATCEAGTPEDERRRLLEVLDALQTDAGVVVPESVRLELLHASTAGSGATYRDMVDWCNEEMSKIVLGQTLTTSEGRRSGSLALGSVHESIRQDYLEADARLLGEVLNGTLVRWLVELNSAGAPPLPRWQVDPSPPDDLEKLVRVDRELLHMGVPLPVSYFHERYGRPAPAGEEPYLIYDDANLFQYHLRHGVLTINEVRHRLHLPPVAWGDERTLLSRDADLPEPQRTASGPSREERSAGEALAERAEREAEHERRGQ